MKIEVEMIMTKEVSRKPQETKLTHIKSSRGWEELDVRGSIGIERIIYLGDCLVDGDTFAIYYQGLISFCKGKLNDGIININK